MSGMAKTLSQRTRLAILILYILGLLVASKLAIGTWLPPTSDRGVWFYSALAALLLGNLLVTPFFTKPADAISYSVAAVIALLAVNIWGAPQRSGFDLFLWSAALLYVATVLITGVLSIAMKDIDSTPRQKLARSCFLLSDALGDPRAIFSVVFLFALVTYHRAVPREYLLIGLAWAVFVGLRPLEALAGLAWGIRRVWMTKGTTTRLGEVVGHESPGIVLVREDVATGASFGDLLIARSESGRPGVAVALDHVGFADGRWLRALHLSPPSAANLTVSDGYSGREVTAGEVFSTKNMGESADVTRDTEDVRKRLLGLVAPDTKVGQLQVEIVRIDSSLRQGSLLEVRIDSRPVLYQVIEGITREEILHQKNTRGFVRAQAKKIGCWSSTRGSFDSIPWLPQPNGPVFLVPQQPAATSLGAVGHFPGTSYPVCVDPHLLVTHNAAILGILGVGKTFLALELVERMVEAGIKVICLDLTDQYATELSRFRDAETETSQFNELQKIGEGGKAKASKHVEEGGSIGEFTAKVRDYLKVFLDPKQGGALKILNPARFTVWRQDSKPYAGEASMATLTPCEVTRMFTEATLSVLQEQGMSDKARCCLVYEEAHSLIPEWNAVASDGDKTATNGTAKAILQGRKFGLGCLVITQRTANVTKSILNQCNTIFALRVFDATGMEFLKNYIGEDYAGVLSNLEDRHAVIFGRASSCKDPVLIRLNDRDAFLRVFREPPPGARTAATSTGSTA